MWCIWASCGFHAGWIGALQSTILYLLYFFICLGIKYFTCFYNLDLKYSGGAFGPHADFMQGESEHFNQLSHTSNHDDFIISDFATSDTSGTSNPTRPPRPTRPTRHGFSRPPHPSSDHFSDHFTTSGFGHSTPSQSNGKISHPSMYSTNTLFCKY